MSKTLLIVDDEQDLRELISDLLSDEGYECLFAGSAQCASEVACKHLESGGSIELVISDVNMPGGSGIDLLKDFRERGIGSPFLFLSGDLVDIEVSHFKSLGVVGYQLKPFHSAEFLNRINSLLKSAA